jgi:hypothetical protein
VTTPTRRELEGFLQQWPAPTSHALNAALLSLPGARMGEWLVGTVAQGGGIALRCVLWQHHFWTLDGPVAFARFRRDVVFRVGQAQMSAGAMIPGSAEAQELEVLMETFVGDDSMKQRLQQMERGWMEVFEDQAAIAWTDLFLPRLAAFLTGKTLEDLPEAPLSPKPQGRL